MKSIFKKLFKKKSKPLNYQRFRINLLWKEI